MKLGRHPHAYLLNVFVLFVNQTAWEQMSLFHIKRQNLPLLDKIDPLAARIGAVNTIVHRDDYLYGYNTDALGLLYALHEHGLGEIQNNKVMLKGYTAIILGAGGAARGAAFALVDAGIEQLVILNRHLERAQSLAADLQQYYDRPIFSLNDPSFLIPRSSSIIINATSVGMHDDISPVPPEILSHFDPDTFVYDMIYNPTQTYLLCQARLMNFKRQMAFQCYYTRERWHLHYGPISLRQSKSCVKH